MVCLHSCSILLHTCLSLVTGIDRFIIQKKIFKGKQMKKDIFPICCYLCFLSSAYQIPFLLIFTSYGRSSIIFSHFLSHGIIEIKTSTWRYVLEQWHSRMQHNGRLNLQGFFLWQRMNFCHVFTSSKCKCTEELFLLVSLPEYIGNTILRCSSGNSCTTTTSLEQKIYSASA